MIESSIFLRINYIRIHSATIWSDIVKSVRDRLSPYLTLQTCLIKISSFPRSMTAMKSPHSFSTHWMLFGDATILLGSTDEASCLALSYYFTKSISTVHESTLCSYLECIILFNEINASAHPVLGEAPNCMKCSLNLSSFYVLALNTALAILDPVSSKLIPCLFTKSMKSPFFVKCTSFGIV